jgi:long-chain acyl-CoA synthetase
VGLREDLRRRLDGDPGAPAIEVAGEWRPVGEMARIARELDRVLTGAGAAPDAPVAFLARNRFAHISAMMGMLAGRHTVVMVHAYQSPRAIAEELLRLRLPVLVADREDLQSEAVREALRELGAVVVALDNAGPGQAGSDLEFREIGAGPFRPSDPDIMIELLTSGTTGAPKRAPIPTATLQQSIDDAKVLNRGGAQQKKDEAPYIQYFPLGNISGSWGLIQYFSEGGRIVLLERFTVEGWLDAVKRYQPQILALPPTALRMVLDAGVTREDLSSARWVRVGTGLVSDALHDDWESAYGVPILPQYGATEFCGSVAGWTLEDYDQFGRTKRGSAGRARPGIGARAVDPNTGDPVGVGETGILELRVPRIGDHWIRTTDLADIDADGFLFIRGRVDSVINRGGFKISPETIAVALRRHPGVADAAAVGVSDPRLGEVPVAAVELKPGATATEAEIMDTARLHLAGPQLPVEIRVLDRLPRTQSLKADLGALKRMFSAVSQTA